MSLLNFIDEQRGVLDESCPPAAVFPMDEVVQASIRMGIMLHPSSAAFSLVSIGQELIEFLNRLGALDVGGTLFAISMLNAAAKSLLELEKNDCHPKLT